MWNSFYKHFKRVHGGRALEDFNSSVEADSTLPTYNSFEDSVEVTSTPQDRVTIGQYRLSIESFLAKMAARFYGISIIPRSIVSSILEDMRSFVIFTVMPLVTFYLQENRLPTTSLPELINLITEIFQPFTSEFKVMQYFIAAQTLISPLPFIVGQRSDFVRSAVGSSRIYAKVDCVAHRIPLVETFRRFFSVTNVLSSTLRYMDSLKGAEVIENFVQGSLWKDRVNAPERSGKVTIPYFLYFDDFELGNALGSRAGVHKLGGVYISFPCLAVDFPSGRFVSSSSLDKIILASLFHSSDRVEFGNAAIFMPIIKEMNQLYLEGIDFHLPDFTGKVYFQLSLLVADNLGCHQLCGFVESFSANRCCRTCRVTKADLQKEPVENPALLRNSFNYFQDLADNDPSLTGVKAKPVWFEVEGFHMLNQIGVDCMHDIFHGVASVTLAFLLKKFIQLRYFNADTLNSRLHRFDFGPDNAAKPVAMSADNINKGNIKQSASGMATLLRYFPLIVYGLIPEDDIYWPLFLALRDVVDLVMAKVCSLPDYSELLESLVCHLNTLFIELSGGPLRPKFHFLVHYPRALAKFGPLSRISSMRFEGKHRLFKSAANVTAGRVNITLTLAKKHQLLLNRLFTDGKFKDPLEIRFTSRTILSTCYNSILTPLLIDGNEKLTVIKWFSYHSNSFRRGAIVASNRDALSRLQFLKIKHILYSHRREKIILIGESLNTVCLDPHYCAYEVVEMSDEVAFLYDTLLSQTTCTLTEISPGGVLYVTLRDYL